MRISAISCWCALSAAAAGDAPTSTSTAATVNAPCFIVLCLTYARCQPAIVELNIELRIANSRIATPKKSLTGHDKMRPAVFRPRPFVVAGLERKFLTVADGSEAIRGNAQRDEIVSRRKRAPL